MSSFADMPGSVRWTDALKHIVQNRQSFSETDARTTAIDGLHPWSARVRTEPSRRLLKVMGLLLVIAIAWATFFQIDKVTRGAGRVLPSVQNQVVQHLEGGIIKEMMVSEGDTVKEGDVLLTLDKTTALANERMLQLRRLRLETIVTRLRAEAQGEKSFKVPDIVMKEAGDPDINAIIQSQNVVFHSKLIKLEEQLNLIEKNIRSLEFRYAGYDGQKQAFDRQLALLTQERDSKEKLAKDGVIRKTDMLALERAIADAMGDIARLSGEMNQSEAEIAKFKQEAIIAVNANKQAALDALETAESDLDSVREQVRGAAEDVLFDHDDFGAVAGGIARRGVPAGPAADYHKSCGSHGG